VELGHRPADLEVLARGSEPADHPDDAGADENLAQPLQCPAQHPVIPFELRLEMNSPQAMLRVFPNQDGAPTPYLPIRLFLCGVCQEVYRERELEVRVQHPEYTQARGSAPVPEGAPLPEEAIRRGREDDHAASR
jgi:hypothetical protein